MILRRTSWRFAAFATVATLALSAPGAAHAGGKCPASAWDKATEFAGKARIHRERKEWDAALDDLRAAYAICPDAKLQKAIGRMLEEAGRSAEAIATYRSCAEEADDEATRADCDARAKVLAAKTASGTLLVEATPPSAEVIVDDDGRALRAGTPVTLPVGRHAVEVRAPGKLPRKTGVDIDAGRQTKLEVQLEALPISEDQRFQVTPVPRKSAIPVVPVSPPPAGETATTLTETAGTRSALWNWVGIGAGVAATGLGLAFLVQYGLDRKNASGPVYAGDGKTVVYSGDEVGTRNLVIGSVFAAVGVAGVITAAVLWPEAPARVTAAPLRGGGLVAVEAPF